MIRDKLYGDHDPYDGITSRGRILPQTWGGRDAIFADLIAEIGPRLIVEVGTWKGASALTMSKHAPDSEVVCVDTFTGGPEHWANPKWREWLGITSGFPTLFQEFQLAVIGAGRQGQITPMPMSSRNAASLFRQWGEKADMIYIDGCHERWSVSADIHSWWGLVAAGGVMFGHDFTDAWPGVCEAVRCFFGQDVEVRGDFWIARKGGA